MHLLSNYLRALAVVYYFAGQPVAAAAAAASLLLLPLIPPTTFSSIGLDRDFAFGRADPKLKLSQIFIKNLLLLSQDKHRK